MVTISYNKRVRVNYQNKPCKSCGDIITVYSGSGYCRKCWHAKRMGISLEDYHNITEKFCERCGKPINNGGLCNHCKTYPDDRVYLNTYRQIIRNGEQIPEHHYVYELFHGQIPQGRIIRHLNGRKGDNRKYNLVAAKLSHHNSSSLLLATQHRILQLEKELGVS